MSSRTNQPLSSLSKVEEKPVVRNWMKNSSFRPAKLVTPQTVSDIQAVVTDNQTFPSPLRAMGGTHSPSVCLENESGTSINMRSLNRVLGLTTLDGTCIPDPAEKKWSSKARREREEVAFQFPCCVEAQAGCNMVELQDWLRLRGLECSFAPEIGCATMGGMVFATTKDSTVGGLCPGGGGGDFQSCVMGLTLVDAGGKLRRYFRFHRSSSSSAQEGTDDTITNSSQYDGSNGSEKEGSRDTIVRVGSDKTSYIPSGYEFNPEFPRLLGSVGTRGICVHVLVFVRPARKIRKIARAHAITNTLVDTLLRYRARCARQGGNLFAMLGVQGGFKDFVYAEERVPLRQRGDEKMACALFNKGAAETEARPRYAGLPMMNMMTRVTTRATMMFLFQRCLVPWWTKPVRWISHLGLARFSEHRHGFKYPEDIKLKNRRLTFSFYAYEFTPQTFREIVEGGIKFARKWKKEHDFTPQLFAVYFSHRSGTRVAGPFRGKPGLSFSFDPAYHDPLDPKWKEFIHAFNAWSIARGAKVSLNQTLELDSEDGAMCVAGTPHPRFTSPWVQQFFDAKKNKAEER